MKTLRRVLRNIISTNTKKRRRRRRGRHKKNKYIVYKRRTRKKRDRKRKTRKRRKDSLKKKSIKCAARNHRGIKPLSYTCFTKKELLLLRKAWNANSEINKLQIIKTRVPRKIYDVFSKFFRNQEIDENKWLNHDVFKKTLINGDKEYNCLNNKLIFAPEAPSEWKKDPYTWLTNFDIEKVMKQHERIDKTFKFIGPTPIDFDDKYFSGKCIQEELCKFDLNALIANGIKKIGIIFNLDKHNQSGSHWVCMFIDNEKHFIFYLDSYGIRAPPRIKKLITRIREQSIREMKNHSEKISTGKKKIKYTYYENDMRHQYSNTECGIYTIHTIKQLLQGKDVFMYDKKIPDALMKKYRREYFNH